MPTDNHRFGLNEAARRFAQHRRCNVDALENHAPTLTSQWLYCQEVLATIRQHLTSLQHNNPGVNGVAVAGSYGRMEAAELSDLDLLVIVDDSLVHSAPTMKKCVSHVWSLLDPIGLKRPEVGGIFMQPVARIHLCDPTARGNLDYPKHVFGQRMQLLLDAQPVFGDQYYINTLQQIVDWYTHDSSRHALWHPAQYPIHDLMRYFRSYNVLHQFDQAFADNDSWYLRQIKMHHSRTLSYLGLLLILTTLDTASAEHASFTASVLTMTPLERVHSILSSDDDSRFNRVVSLYDRIQSKLISDECRMLLLEQPARGQADSSEMFTQLMNDCGELRQCLTLELTRYQQRLPEQIQAMLML